MLNAAAKELGVPGYTAYWAGNPAAQSGGVAILVSSALLHSGMFTVVGSPTIDDTDDGRLICMSCKWAGHSFQLVSAYLPSGDPAGQHQFVSHRLHKVLQAATTPVVLAGDFNFTTDWQLDRTAGTLIRARAPTAPQG
jgi:exonuclease III